VRKSLFSEGAQQNKKWLPNHPMFPIATVSDLPDEIAFLFG